MANTRVGYAGGTTPNPTYRKLGDHTETIQIEFDAQKISYEELLDVFWQNHTPWEHRPVQYMSIIFVHSNEQEQVASKSLVLQEEIRHKKIVTEIRPYDTFYLAEDYHQKYYLRRIPELSTELLTVYPESEDFVSSTVVARVNGYVAGLGTPESLANDLDEFGLSPQSTKKLSNIVSRMR